MPGITFPVSELPVAAKPCELLDVPSSVAGALQYPVEAMGLSDPGLVCCNDAHPFAQAAHDAFYKHYPLVISPDDIWFCIAQGFAQHVNLNAESLRHHFVQHQGKEKLIVDRPDFRLGQPNPWPEVFSAFSEQIAGHVGSNLRDLVVSDFSTTTPMHRAASEVVLMDAFQAYFEYEMMCGCGIPEITLRGAPDDWRDIRRRAAALAQYGLSDWISCLLPVLDEIEATSRGHVNRNFWKSFFRYDSGSGGCALTGWIQVFFPYLKDCRTLRELVPNEYLKTWEGDLFHAIKQDAVPWREQESIRGPYLLQFPTGLASAPVKVTDRIKNEVHDMRFVAGIFGISQDEMTRALSPAFGWAVVYDKRLPPPERRSRFGRRSTKQDN